MAERCDAAPRSPRRLPRRRCTYALLYAVASLELFIFLSSSSTIINTEFSCTAESPAQSKTNQLHSLKTEDHLIRQLQRDVRRNSLSFQTFLRCRNGISHALHLSLLSLRVSFSLRANLSSLYGHVFLAGSKGCHRSITSVACSWQNHTHLARSPP